MLNLVRLLRGASTQIITGAACLLIAASIGLADRAMEAPINEGLQLILEIEPLQSRDATDSMAYEIQLTLSNVGSEPVSLQPLELSVGGDTFEEVFLETLTFVTVPEVLPTTAQTASLRTRAFEDQKLRAGEKWVYKWEVPERAITKPPGFNPSGGIRFPADGLYTVRAEALARLDEEHLVLLISNPETMSIGGSQEMPKHATAEIVMTNPERQTVWINLGEIHRLEQGDVFRVRRDLLSGWRLDVLDPGRHRSECRVTTYDSMPSEQGPNPNRRIDPVPPVGSKAALEPVPEDQAD